MKTLNKLLSLFLVLVLLFSSFGLNLVAAEEVTTDENITETEETPSSINDETIVEPEVQDVITAYSEPAEDESVPEASDNEISDETMVEPEETEESGQEETDSDISASAEKEEDRQIETVPPDGDDGDRIALKSEITCKDGTVYEISVEYGSDAGIPAIGTELAVTEVDYDIDYLKGSSEAMDISLSEITFMKLFDISICDSNGNTYQPEDNVSVSIKDVTNEEMEGEYRVVHFDGNLEAKELEVEKTDTSSINFKTEGFSVFAITNTELAQDTAKAEFVSGALYENDEIILEGMMPAAGIIEAVPQTISVSGRESLIAYDINIYASEEMKEMHIKWQPAEDRALRVTFKSTALNSFSDISVYHAENPDAEADFIKTAEVSDASVTFEAERFSVYALIDVPVVELPDAYDARNMDEIEDPAGFNLSIIKNGSQYYFGNTINEKNCVSRTAAGDISSAGVWHFEHIESNKYALYTVINGSRSYLNVRSDGYMEMNDGSSKTIYEVGLFNDGVEGVFYIKKDGTNMYLNYSGSNKSFKTWTTKNDDCKIILTHPPVLEDDPYKLNGKTYGLVNIQDEIRGYAAVQDGTDISAVETLIKSNPINHTDMVFVSSEIDMIGWTFHSKKENYYLISTEIDGRTYYLHVENDGTISLQKNAGDASEVRLSRVEKDGEHYIQIAHDAKYLSYSNSSFKFVTPKGTANEQFAFVDRSELEDDDFVNYSARLTSASDTEQIKNGTKVALYVRIWNAEELKYEFFIVNYDGTLIPAYKTGDKIEWVGTKIDTAAWTFNEYYYEGTTNPNYYYDIQNQYSGKYLAPSLETDSILFDSPVGITLNGRRYGDTYTSIIAWDDEYYSYAGLKVDDKIIKTGIMSKAIDFYFAVYEESGEDDTLTEVTPTIDNSQYGIRMRLQNYGNRPEDVIKPENADTSAEQHAVLGKSKYDTTGPTYGLLSTNLVDGYPVATETGRSLSELYVNGRDANHLFPAINYYNSGYFQFDSTNNYAYFNKRTGNFTVYEELGTTDSGGSKLSLKHGQFLPYNDLTPGLFASTNGLNLYDTAQNELSNDNPRKFEPLYLVPKPDYFYGMEMSVDFIQTPSGLDAWGNDIIFEFTGDDDFWLYVDGELVIDLGGIHSALPGSMNFRTGDVLVNGRSMKMRNIFRDNYRQRNPEATDAEVDAYLDEIFILNEDGNYVFKDYSSHTMKMFYMERGAGAANLKMRFNIASFLPNQVLFSKKITGTAKEDYNLAEFPFQIYYSQDNEDWQLLELANVNDATDAVYYNTNTPVKYAPSYTPSGTNKTYENVFFLKAKEMATITFPEGTEYYKIVECATNTKIYDAVYANEETLTGTAIDETNDRKDFHSPVFRIDETPVTEFTNNVSGNALRTLTIEKDLLDENNQNINFEDDSKFNFRLYLANENEELSLAYLQDYFVKDADGNFCIWDVANKTFASLGISNYDDLTAEQKTRVTFTSSSNGSISRIPAGYKVVVDDLLVGTKFMVEERASEIPDGYRLKEYQRVDGTYIIGDTDSINSGTIRDNSDPVIKVVNKRGYSIKVAKEWADKDFAEWHGDVYVALFKNNALIEGSVRKITNAASSANYYYDTLEGGSISDIMAREVRLEGGHITENEGGVIAGYDSVEIIDGPTTIPAIMKGSEIADYIYTPVYSQDAPEGYVNNIQKKKITNTRQGIEIVKEDYAGNPITGAQFILKEGEDIIGSFRSDGTGLVTNAFLKDGGEYLLTESSVPNGFEIVNREIRFTVSNGSIQLIGEYEENSITADNAGHRLVIRNRPVTFQIVKKDAVTNEPVENVKFALYKQVNSMIDYIPINGFESLLTDENGIVPGISETLPKGTYYLREIETLPAYEKIDEPVCFTITQSGEITMAGHASAMLEVDKTKGTAEYTIAVSNHLRNMATVKIVKHVKGNLGNREDSFRFMFNDNEFLLSDGESREFIVDKNSAFSLMENTDTSEYIVSFKVTYHGEDITDEFVTDTRSIVGTCVGDMIVEVTNTRNVAVPTEIRFSAYAGLILIGFVGIYFLLRRRRLD